jgi:hypothetical protein
MTVRTNLIREHLEGTAITAVGELLVQQEDARSIIVDAKGTDDRSAMDGVIAECEYPEDIIVDTAVILRSLKGGGTVKAFDVISAIGFLDFASTLRLELRRRENADTSSNE